MVPSTHLEHYTDLPSDPLDGGWLAHVLRDLEDLAHTDVE